MASGFKWLSKDKSNHSMNAVNGEVLTETEDPYALMSEFSSLYSEKLKAIEENCEDPTEAKIRTLQDWVNDLTEQNYVLIKTVEELEREALNRVNAVSLLADQAKESMHKDDIRQESKNNLREFEEKVAALHKVIEENNKSLDACMKEVEKLSKMLADKNKECDMLRSQNQRLQGIPAGTQSFAEEMDSIDTSFYSFRGQKKTLGEDLAAERRLAELRKEAQRVQKELKEKLKKLSATQSQRETVMGEIADLTERLQDLRGSIRSIQEKVRRNSAVTKAVLNRSIKALDDYPTSGSRLQELPAGMESLQEEMESIDPLRYSYRDHKTTLVLKDEDFDAARSLPELRKEAQRVPNNSKEKLKKLSADLDSNSSLVDHPTSGSFPDFYYETDSLLRNPMEDRSLSHISSARASRAKMFIEEIEKAHKDLKEKTEALNTPQGKMSRTLPLETAISLLRYEDLKNEVKKRRSTIVNEPLDKVSEAAGKTKKSLYDPTSAMSRDQDLDVESNLENEVDLPLGRADIFMDDSKLALDRIQELERDIEKTQSDLRRKTEVLKSPEGRRNENLVKEAAVTSIKFHDLEEELDDIEYDLREKTKSILSILEDYDALEEHADCFERLEELQNEVVRIQKELIAKTEALQSSEGRIEALVYGTQEAARRLNEMKNKVTVLEKKVKEKEELLRKANPESFQEEIKRKEDLLNNLQKQLEKAKGELEKKDEQFLSEKKRKEAMEEEIEKMKSSGDSSLLKLKVSDLEKQLKEKKNELTEIKKENEEKAADTKKLEATIDKLKHDYNEMRCNYAKTDELLKKSSCREEAFKTEICRLQKELECYQIRIQKHEQKTKMLEQQLENLQSSSCFDDPNRSQEFNEQIRCLLSTIKNKDMELEKHIEQEKQLCFQISKMEHCVKERDRQMSLMSETMKKISCELRAKSSQLEKMEEENTRNNLHTINDVLDSRSIICTGCNFKTKESDVTKLKSKLKDMQEALTAEIADKHDEIRRLKDDVKELEDKLLQSDKQTQFRDDIIKELRKEVKMGRAKESLAEMLGLKGTPRAMMKNRIENLTGQMEEMRSHILSLESRLAECNLPAVLSLRSRLNNAEGSLLAMCNKMDYVRRYLENLKGDEQLSMKCGLEALLNELRDDVEWNRQTRRNLSLDEGTSVIVISHRSRSLPDNSLHRPPVKTQSESAVASNKQLATNFHHSLDTFQECKNYIHTINELESDFDETDKAILDTWNSLKLWSQGSSDSVLKEFNNVIKLCLQGNETLANLASQVGNTLDKKVDQNNGCNLAYLEGNLIELGRYLTKANMVAPVSDPDVSKEEIVDEKASISKKISVVISDSLSLLYDMKKNNSAQVPLHVKECLQDLMVSFSTILGSKKMFLEKLVALEKQQVDFLKNFLDRVNEFDLGMSSYHDTAENLKNEIRKLFSVLLTKENQIQKQCDEINNLKALLSTSDKSEHNYEEVSNLRKVVSNKDLQLIEKDEMIHNLRSLNYTLRRTKSSRSSLSASASTDLGANLEEKLQQLEDCMLNIKGNLSSVFLYLVKNQEKLAVFEEDARSLVQILAKTHQEISHIRESSSDEKGDSFSISSIIEHLDNTAIKVEQLINVVEVFLCDSEKLDLNFISEVLRRKLMKLMYIAEFIKKSAIQEHSFIKSVVDENEDFKKKGSNKDEAIKNLTDSLNKAQNDLQALQDQYSHLKSQKEDMELKNQKVMEELQAKISSLQEAASRIQSSDSESLLLLQKTSQSQIEKLKQLEKRELALKNALIKKDKALEMSKKEEKELMNMVNVLRSENLNLQSQVNEARRLIFTLQKSSEDKKVENDNLKIQLEEMGNLSALQNLEVDRLHKELLSTTVKLDEAKVAEALLNEKYKKLEDELQMLKEEEITLGNNIVALKEELMKKNDEIAKAEHIIVNQKENSIKYLEEIQALKMQHEEDEKIKVKFEYELEKAQDDLQLIQGREYINTGELVEKNQAIYQLNLEKLKLESYVKELETILKERNKILYLGDEKGDVEKSLIEEKEEIIEYLKICLNQMRQYITERDETIKLIEGQLKVSTELLADDSDGEERLPNDSLNRQNIISQRVSAYKSKLHQAMQQNWRLVSMVDKLQNINFTLLSDRTNNMNKPGLELVDDAAG